MLGASVPSSSAEPPKHCKIFVDRIYLCAFHDLWLWQLKMEPGGMPEWITQVEQELCASVSASEAPQLPVTSVKLIVMVII